MQPPHRRGEGCRGHPWVNGLPEPARARGHEPAEKAGHGEKTLKPLRGETRVTWRKLDGLQSTALRSHLGLWLQRLTARWTLSTGTRRAGAPSEGPAPRQECGQGMHGPPPSRADGRYGGTAGWPTGREPSGHGACVVVRGRASRPHGQRGVKGAHRRRKAGFPRGRTYRDARGGEPKRA
jgi:hypothetical protein